MRPMRPPARPEPNTARWAPRHRPSVLAWVLLAHGLLLLGWHSELMPRLRGTPAPLRQPALVWLQLPVAGPAQPRAATGPAPIARTPSPARAEPRARRLVEVQSPAMATVRPPDNPAPDTSAAIHLPAPEPAASAASAPHERLLDTAATRAAIRQAGRTALLSERAASATDQAFTSQREREAQAIARTAKGDCLKGDFAGGGLGLLSVPFFVVAEVRGQCAR